MDTYSYSKSDLRTYTVYDIGVGASTSAGPGPPGRAQSVTTEEYCKLGELN